MALLSFPPLFQNTLLHPWLMTMVELLALGVMVFGLAYSVLVILAFSQLMARRVEGSRWFCRLGRRIKFR